MSTSARTRQWVASALLGIAGVLQLPLLIALEPWSDISNLLGDPFAVVTGSSMCLLLVILGCTIAAIAAANGTRTVALPATLITLVVSVLGLVAVLGRATAWDIATMLTYAPESLLGVDVGRVDLRFPGAYTVSWILILAAFVILAIGTPRSTSPPT